jgi:dTMP kinase
MFISFEGIDGSGKTTQIKQLQARLEAEGHETLFVREPGGTELSEKVRALLLDPSLHIVPFAEMLLFSAARAQLTETVIKPALAQGKIVLADRFFDSTIAYQGAGRGIADAAWIEAFQLQVTGGLKPHRTYLVDVSLEVAEARQHQRENAKDRMESAGKDFYERVLYAYRALAQREKSRFCVLDGNQSADALHEQIWADVITFM